ncbi:seryl-tRNA synthetase family protein [Streptococcus pneumoniae]|nr:seryl-tRNA synthetase family protein [Streptococcus pneumoniae]
MAEFTFEIEEHLLTLSENEKGWTKEINRVSFNGAPAKFDIRAWSPDHTKMGKGITLSNEEFQTMVDAFKASIQENHSSCSILSQSIKKIKESDSRSFFLCPLRKSLQTTSASPCRRYMILTLNNVLSWTSSVLSATSKL